MSLIEEALRRVHDPLIRAHEMKAGTSPATELSDKPHAHSWPTAPPLSNPSVSTLPQERNAPLLMGMSLAALILTVALLIGGTLWIGQTLDALRASRSVRASRLAANAPVAASEPLNGLTGRRNTTSKRAGYAQLTQASQSKGPDEARLPLLLSGVVEGRGEPYAVLNGMIIGIGDRVGDTTLIEIADGSVTLRHENGDEIVLRVPR